MVIAWSGREKPDVLVEAVVHVWAAVLDVAPPRRAALGALLSEDERRREAQFRRKVHADRFAVGRGVLRELVGCYVGRPPEAIRFDYDEHRKPTLAGDSSAHSLEFNVTHADDLALYAFALGARVGVDVEPVQAFPDMMAVAEQNFSVAERRALTGAETQERTRMFYRIWTRKEAYLKAQGVGLVAPLDQFDVSCAHDAPPALLRVQGEPAAPAQWSMIHLEPAPGFLGAVAVKRSSARATCRCWRG